MKISDLYHMPNRSYMALGKKISKRPGTVWDLALWWFNHDHKEMVIQWGEGTDPKVKAVWEAVHALAFDEFHERQGLDMQWVSVYGGFALETYMILDRLLSQIEDLDRPWLAPDWAGFSPPDARRIPVEALNGWGKAPKKRGTLSPGMPSASHEHKPRSEN